MLDNFELEQFSSRSNQIHEDSKQLFLLQHSHFERILNDETRQLAGESPRCYLSFLQKLGKCCVPFSICCRCFLTYPLYQQATGEVGILSKFGRYEATVEPGLRVLNPITQKIISVSLKTQTLRIEQDVITKDNVKVKIESVIFYRVFAPVEVVYKLGSDMWHTTQCVSQIAGASLRSVAGCVQLQGLIEKREAVGESLAAEINRQVDMWGIVVDICSIKQLFVEKETGEILAAVATARRKSQAMLISARANASCAQMLKYQSSHANPVPANCGADLRQPQPECDIPAHFPPPPMIFCTFLHNITLFHNISLLLFGQHIHAIPTTPLRFHHLLLHVFLVQGLVQACFRGQQFRFFGTLSFLPLPFEAGLVGEQVPQLANHQIQEPECQKCAEYYGQNVQRKVQLVRDLNALAVPDKVLVVLSQEQAYATESHFHQTQQEHKQKQGELADVVRTHTIVDPRAVVIISMDASPTYVAMKHFIRDPAFALSTEIAINLHEGLGFFLRGFPQEQEVHSQNYDLVESFEHEGDYLDILFIDDVELGEEIGGEEEKMEEEDEVDGVGVGRVFWLIHDLFVTLYLNLIAGPIVVIQNSYQIVPLVEGGYLQGGLPVVVPSLATGSLDQQELNHFLLQLFGCHYEWSFAVIISCLNISPDGQQVGHQLGIAFARCQVQHCITTDICLIDLVLMLRLDQIDEGFYPVMLHTHEQQVVILSSPVLHVRPAFLKELNHLQVPVQSRIHDRNVPLLIRGVNPCFQFIRERRVASVKPRPVVGFCKLFEVFDKDLHPGQVILERRKMKEGTVSFVLQD